MILNKEELAVGALFGLCFVCIFKWWIIITAPVCAILWAMGGSSSFDKNWRRLGIPTLMCIVSMIVCRSFWPALSWIPLWLVLATGYGIPGPDDSGSPLGRWVAKYMSPSYAATTYTRMIIGAAACLSMFTLIRSIPTFFGWAFAVIAFPFGYAAVVKFIEGDIEI